MCKLDFHFFSIVRHASKYFQKAREVCTRGGGVTRLSAKCLVKNFEKQDNLSLHLQIYAAFLRLNSISDVMNRVDFQMVQI